MRALITGAAGFCGRYLVSRLSREPGVTVAGLDITPAPQTGIPFADYFPASITDPKSVEDALTDFRPDFLFHLAGIGLGSSTNNVPQARIFEVNSVGTVTLLEAALHRVPDCRVLLVGSAAEYGPVADHALPVVETTYCQPESAYGISKFAATLAGLNAYRQHGLKVVVARPFNVLGPGMPTGLVVSDLISRAARALELTGPAVVEVGDLSTERDFIAAEDVVNTYVGLLRGDFWGEIFNICSGRAYSVRAVAEMLFANSHKRIVLSVNPSLVRPSAVRRFWGSYAKASRAIGFEPSIHLEDVLRQTWESQFGVAACA